MIRVVIDTSVLIRYLIRPGAAVKELIEVQWLADQVRMVSAPELIKELEGVLGRDYIQTLIRPEEGQALLHAIHLKAETLPPLGNVPPYTRDRKVLVQKQLGVSATALPVNHIENGKLFLIKCKDDKFVACALIGKAAYVISEDRDLLALGVLQSGLDRVQMVTPHEFIQRTG